MAIIQHGAAIRIDVQANTQGVKTMRTDLASLTRLVNQSTTQHEKFEKTLEKIAAVQQAGIKDPEFTSKAVIAAANNFLQAEKAAGRYAEAIAYVARRVPELAGEMARLRSELVGQEELERAAKIARQRQELNEKLYKEQVDRDRKVAAQSKRLAEENAKEQARLERQKNAEIKSLQQQAADVEAYFDEQGRQRRKAYDAEQKAQTAAFWKFVSDGAKQMAAEREADAKRERDLSEALFKEKQQRQREAAALSKRLDKEAAQARVEAERQALEQINALQKQADDVEAYFDQIGRKRAEEYTQFIAQQEQKRANLRKQFAIARSGMAEEPKEQTEETDAQTLARRRRTQTQKAQEVIDEAEQARLEAQKAAQKQLSDVEEFFEQNSARRRALYLAHRRRIEQQEAERLAQIKKQEVADRKKAERAATEEAAAKERAQRRVNRIIQEGMTPAERLQQRLEKLRLEMEKGRISAEQFARAQQVLNSQMAKMNAAPPIQARGGLADFAGGLGAGLTPMGALTAGAAGFFVANQTTQFAKESVQAYMDMRSAIIKLEVTLGSATKAQVMFNQLRSLAAQMSLTQEAVLSGAVTMAQFGVSAEQLEPAMRRISIISAGNSERLRSLAIAYGQVAAAGRLTGQETLQFVNAGFNPLAEIARTTGKSMAVLRKEMEEGRITVEMVANAFKSATEQGGRFFGMAEKLAGELSGKLNKLSSEFTKVKEEIAGLALETTQAPETVDVFTENLRKFRQGINVLRTDLRAFMQGGPSMTGELFDPNMSSAKNQAEIFQNIATGKTFAERELLRAQERIKKIDEAHAFFATQAEALPILAGEAMKTAKEGAKSLFDQARDFGDNAMKSMAKSLEDDMKKRVEAVKAAIKTPEEKQLENLQEVAQLIRYNYITIAEGARFLAKDMQMKDAAISTDLPRAVSMGR